MTDGYDLASADTLMNLSDRLKAARKGSRLLDAAIYTALYSYRTTHPDLPPGYTMDDQRNKAKNASLANSNFISRARCGSPKYTTDMGDAHALIDPKWDYSLMRLDSGITVFCRIGTMDQVVASDDCLAVCAAVLRRLAYEEDQDLVARWGFAQPTTYRVRRERR